MLVRLIIHCVIWNTVAGDSSLYHSCRTARSDSVGWVHGRGDVGGYCRCGGSGQAVTDGLGRDVSTRSVAAAGPCARDLVRASVRKIKAVHDGRRRHREVRLAGLQTGSPLTSAARQGGDSVVGLMAPAQAAGSQPACRSDQTVRNCIVVVINPSGNTTAPNVISMAGARILREVDGDPA